MATTPTETITAEPNLVLTPPDPVPAVAPTRAAGLVPVDDAKKTELEARVDAFIDDLVAQDVDSPEFGKRVDAITNMGQKEIREAASQSNRFLDRPVRAMDKDQGVGADLVQLRLTIEKLDPANNGKFFGGGRGFLDKIFGTRLTGYFDQYKSSQNHISAILKSLGSGKDE
ncbi:MAG: toxic anion resistance protein, partial [Proteobacteria bacterium]|nr:toxic anion resistance protein [Pseudomonadota bacterium]